MEFLFFFFFSSRRRHTRSLCDWSSDVCSSDLEAALKLTEAHGGDVQLVSMAGPGAPETMRKALAMGAATGTLVTDETLGGSDTLSTARVLAAALRGLE